MLRKTDGILWSVSVLAITAAFFVFGATDYLTLSASLIGATSLIFNAKGNPIGQVLMLIFSVLYGIISFRFAYYGEMITYLGMTAPMAATALVAWLRHPYRGNAAEVEVASVKRREWIALCALSAVVTVVFYGILRAFSTANLMISTLSVTTSFIAAYLTFRRSPWFAAAYAANDVVLIVLWVLAAMTDRTYGAVVVCFAVFLCNDIYGFISWLGMQRRQQTSGGIV